MVISGVNREIVPPERGVRTERFEIGCGPQVGEQLATLVLTERQGKTTLTLLYPPQEARDGASASGWSTAWPPGTTDWTGCWRRAGSNRKPGLQRILLAFQGLRS